MFFILFDFYSVRFRYTYWGNTNLNNIGDNGVGSDLDWYASMYNKKYVTRHGKISRMS